MYSLASTLTDLRDLPSAIMLWLLCSTNPFLRKLDKSGKRKVDRHAYGFPLGPLPSSY